MHLPGQVFELLARILKTLPLDVIVRRVREQLVQRDDVARNLLRGERKRIADRNEGETCSFGSPGASGT